MSDESGAQVFLFEEWKSTADHLLRAHYAIDTEDAGLSESDLREVWADGETPIEFVKRWARKYDLTHVSEFDWMPQHPIL